MDDVNSLLIDRGIIDKASLEKGLRSMADP